jgi:hypothetical protein
MVPTGVQPEARALPRAMEVHVRRRNSLAAAVLLVLGSATAAAQDQVIIVDQALQLCAELVTKPDKAAPDWTPITRARLTESQAGAVIRAALGTIESETYYIVHATEFVQGRMTVAEESWHVYYQPWTTKPALWWFKDSRHFNHFRETRIFGAARVGLVYVYLNVPAYSTESSLEDIRAHFEKVRGAELDALSGAKLTNRLNELNTSLRGSLTAEEEAEALGLQRDKQGQFPPPPPPTRERIIRLEAARYVKAFGRGDAAIRDEITLINQDTGEALTALSPTVATSPTFAALSSLFYRVGVTKKIPAPLDNLKSAAKFAFGAQAAEATRLYVPVTPSPVCAGRYMDVRHVPSDMLVDVLTKSDKDEIKLSKQTFDNEGKYIWDVSFALPVESRDDLTVDVDEGQVAAKKVEKTDLFAVINLGLPRDTKKLQWQLIPSIIYGMPITGKPLQHHLVGFTVGLNYVQLVLGWRIDRREEVTSGETNGIPTGIESTPPGDKWTDWKWTWGLNIPVNTIVKLFKKDGD